MRSLPPALSLALIPFLFFPQLQHLQTTDKCVVAGRVFRAATGEPLRKVSVVLRDKKDNSQGVTTDAEGRFFFSDVLPGAYEIIAQRPGFVTQKWTEPSRRRGGNFLVLETGQRREDIVIRLEQTGVVYGRLYDGDGDPLVNGTVQAMQQVRVGGKFQFYASESVGTNDLGEFRLFDLKPGRYVVCGQMGGEQRGVFQTRELQQLGVPPPPREAFILTCYPNSPEPAQATPIVLGPGGEVRVDLTLLRGQTYVVRGRVHLPEGVASAAFVHVSLVRADSDDTVQDESSSAQTVDQAGNFELRDVRPGSYILLGGVRLRERQYAGETRVQVSSQNVQDVVVFLSASVELVGKVHFPGDVRPKLGYVRLVSAGEGSPRFHSAGGKDLKSDGTFRLEGIFAGEYAIEFASDEGFYAKSVRLGQRELEHKRIRIDSGGEYPPLEIWLGQSAAVVEGIVAQDGEPVDGALVCLMGDERQGPECRESDERGTFRFEGVRPGSYRAYALEELDNYYSLREGPEFETQIERFGKAIRVDDNSRIRLELIPVPRKENAPKP